MKRVALVRMDRIGDLIVTLPMDHKLEPSQYEVTWFITEGLGVILNQGEKPRSYFELSKNLSFKNLIKMWRLVRLSNFDSVVIFHAPAWVSFIFWLTQVPVRIGRYSQWHSFLFFNSGLRQKRHLSEKHEYEYNQDLVNLLGPVRIVDKNSDYFTFKKLTDSRVLSKFSLLEKKYYVVHPGMGGSALNWNSQKYIELIKTLSQQSNIVITGTAGDRSYIAPIYEALKNQTNVIWCQEKLSMSELIVVLQNALAVVAPSTGVAHLAAASNVATLGIYSSVMAESAARWAPLGKRVLTLTAPHQDMDSITLNMATEALARIT